MEGAHWILKRILKLKGIKSLAGIVHEIHRLQGQRHRDYLSAVGFQETRISSKWDIPDPSDGTKSITHPLLAELVNHVSEFAVDMVWGQIKLIGSDKPCRRGFRSTFKLPCVHEIMALLARGISAIPLQLCDPRWLLSPSP